MSFRRGVGVLIPQETWAGRLVRLRGAAANNNPVESPQLIGSVAWVTGAVSAAGAVVSNVGNVYKTIAGGTNGATAPTHITGSVSDGTVAWVWQGVQTAPTLSAISTTHNGAYTKSYAITSANYVDNVAPFRWRGGVPQAAFTGSAVRSVNNSPGAGNLGGTFAGQNGSISFMFEGTSCEIAIRDASATRVVNIIVNGRNLDSTVKLVNGGVSYFTLDFTNVVSLTGISRASGFQRNVVTIDGKDGQIYNGVNCLPTDSLSYPDTIDNFTAVYIGDSQGAGGGPAPVAQANFSWQLMHMMGLPDMQNCSIGGTGFVSAATGYPTYGGHAVADLQYQNAFRPIGLIFVQLSANDHDVTGLLPVAGLSAASLALFQSLRATFPLVPIVATGLVTGGAVAVSVHQAIEAIHAANIATMQAAGDNLIFYVPAARDPNGAWITGTGNAGATDGTGNADFNISSDDLHMTVAGNSLYARKVMGGFLNQISQQ